MIWLIHRLFSHWEWSYQFSLDSKQELFGGLIIMNSKSFYRETDAQIYCICLITIIVIVSQVFTWRIFILLGTFFDLKKRNCGMNESSSIRSDYLLCNKQFSEHCVIVWGVHLFIVCSQQRLTPRSYDNSNELNRDYKQWFVQWLQARLAPPPAPPFGAYWLPARSDVDWAPCAWWPEQRSNQQKLNVQHDTYKCTSVKYGAHRVFALIQAAKQPW